MVQMSRYLFTHTGPFQHNVVEPTLRTLRMFLKCYKKVWAQISKHWSDLARKSDPTLVTPPKKLLEASRLGPVG